jgi:tetratricopeptide (TPR) repeat protein
MPLDPDRERHPARGSRALAAIAVLLALAPAPAGAADGPSAGVLLRRARSALAEGRSSAAIAELTAVRAAEPASHRGLEAAVLLADLQLRAGDPATADRTLASAARDVVDGEPAAQILLARGWLAIARGDADGALAHFALVPARSDVRSARELALLGTGWARLVAAPRTSAVPPELVTLASSADDPQLRIGAQLSLARAYAYREEHRKALRALRALRRQVRGTSFADDVELGIGLVQLEMGRPAAARKTLARVVDDPTTASASPLPEAATALTLADLRLPPAAFAARLAALWASRARPDADLGRFLSVVLDRPARADAAAALSVAEAALAAGREA